MIALADLPLTRAEIRLASLVLSPAYVWPLARELGAGDPVRGAPRAYHEIREVLRAVLRAARRRERRGRDAAAWRRRWRELKQALEVLGGWPEWQPVEPLAPSGWRMLAAEIEPGPWAADGWTRELAVTEGARADLSARVATVLGALLRRHPELNRAHLDGRTWQRATVWSLEFVRLRADEVRPILYRPSPVTEETAAARRAALLRVRRSLGHPLERTGLALWSQWCRAGFLTSPASFCVSNLTGSGVGAGFAKLVRGNGVPVAIAIGDGHAGGSVRFGVSIDHRTFDPEHGGAIHRCLSEEVLRSWPTS